MAAEWELGLRGAVEVKAAGRKRGAWSSMGQKPQNGRSCEAAASSIREEERILQLMMGPMDRPPPASSAPLLLQELAQRSSTLGLQALKDRVCSLWGSHSTADMCSTSSRVLELDSQGSEPLPSGWEKCLDLQTGSIYYLNRSTGRTTSSDPRLTSPAPRHHRPRPLHLLNCWPPTSPSSSSDLTFEGVPPISNCSHDPPPVPTCPAPQKVASSPPRPPPPSELDLDLSLSLRPCKAPKKRSRPRPPSQSLPTHSQQTLSRDNPSLNITHAAAGNLSVMEQTSASAYTNSQQQLKAAGLGGSVGKASTLAPSLQDLLNSSMIADADDSNHQSGNLKNSNMMMITAACANCLMYVLLPHSGHPTCPRCGVSIHISTSSTCSSPFFSDKLPPSPPSKKSKEAAISLSISLSPLPN